MRSVVKMPMLAFSDHVSISALHVFMTKALG
jgi:hypothetical protein